MGLKPEHQGHVPQAPAPAGDELATLTVEGTVVAHYQDGAALPAVLAPRPFLHPVRTLAGTPVTDAQPEDHRWHLGISVTLQDVGGANVWGGRTYLRGQGYTWRADHGRQVHAGWRARDEHGFQERLEWLGPDGAALLTEDRTVAAGPSGLAGGWLLELRFTLRNATAAPLALGSPATNGRAGAGYGGVFWRLPTVAGPARVFTPDAHGEEAVHGATSRWVAFAAGGRAPFTVALSGLDSDIDGGLGGASRGDPWFVRVAGYPGLGAQLAATEPVRLAVGAATTRCYRALVADGELGREEVERGLHATSRAPGEDR